MDRGGPAGAQPGGEEVDAAEPAAKRPQKRKNLFGRADLAEVYRRARDMLAERGVFRMVQVTTEGDGSSSLVICNLWRVDRSKDGVVKALEMDMATGRWAEVKELVYWPSVPLFPIQQAQSLGWWRDVARSAVWKVLKAAGYDALPRCHTEVVEGYDAKTGRKKAVSGRPEMTPGKLAYILVERYVGKEKRCIGTGGDEWSKGVLKPEVMTAGARALRAAIFDHVIEADLMSAILAIDFKLVTLWDYLRYAAHRDAVLRVARERRNLLPLLPAISKEYWDRKDLFSRKLWVKDGRKRTLVDYARFSEGPRSAGFSSLDSRGALRWLSKAQLTVVRRWSSVGKDVTVLENLSRASISVKIPAIAWCHIVTAGSTGRAIAQLGVRESVQRLYRAFAAHCAEMWKEKGFAALKGWLKTEQANLGDVYDWLIAEGLAQGHPDKHATWNSIMRRCDDWHERVAIDNVERSVGDNRTWESLIGEVLINDVTFTPLNSVQDIAREGYRQQHCVGDYAGDCEDGHYRVYTVLEPDETRSTLGLWLDGSGQWKVEQHRGKYNGAVSVVAAKAGLELVRRYQQLHLGRMKPALADGSM